MEQSLSKMKTNTRRRIVSTDNSPMSFPTNFNNLLLTNRSFLEISLNNPVTHDTKCMYIITVKCFVSHLNNLNQQMKKGTQNENKHQKENSLNRQFHHECHQLQQ